ncbi:hypothetical protein GGI07_005448 [Coemansia sp. Benny D115]|nr:hypothetical protein GGI07_005448 [Coemansia sp. Benny D115]
MDPARAATSETAGDALDTDCVRWQNAPGDILWLVFGWLYPRLSTQPVEIDIPRRLTEFGRLAAVCRGWRAAALPMLYSTCVVVADIASLGSGAGGSRNAASASKGATANRGLVHRAAVQSNAGLALDLGCARHAHELIVCTLGPSPPPDALLQALRWSGLCEAVWPSIKKLTIQATDSAQYTQRSTQTGTRHGSESTLELNKELSAALPQLREIAYFDVNCHSAYKRFPLDALVGERTNGSSQLHALRLFVDLPPVLRRYQKRPLATPVVHIVGVNFTRPARMPLLAADTLVELTLTSVPQHQVWEAFVPSPVSTSAVNTLEFPCLRSLTLMFFWRYRTLGAWRTDENTDSESDTHMDITDHAAALSSENKGNVAAGSYLASSVHGRPRFPALERLDIHRFAGDAKQFLSLFRTSPIRSLLVAGLQTEIPQDISFAAFTRLESLCVRLIGEVNSAPRDYMEQMLEQISYTPPPTLQRLSLSAGIGGPTLPLPVDPEMTAFAHGLRVLHISSAVDLNATMQPLLRHLSGLETLTLESVLSTSVQSIALLIQTLRSASDIVPVSTSLRRLQIGHVADSSGGDGARAGGAAAAGYSSVVSLHAGYGDAVLRGILVDLVCRLPCAYAMVVHAPFVPGLRKALKMLAAVGVISQRPRELGHLAVLHTMAYDEG